MLKNIQKNLLLKNPLIWNSRIIPFAALGIVFHIIFFVLGYIQGEISFEEEYKYYNYFFDTEDTIIFTSILISIFTTIIWLVLYSRNNAFKSFYPKHKLSLFKEWLLILAFFVFNTTSSLTYMYGKDVKARSYFSREEIIKRTEIVSGASIFLRGELNVSEYSTVEKKNADGTLDYIQVKVDSFDYNKRKYPIKSLLNKKINSFIIFNDEQDSLRELKIKNWLVQEKKDSVKLLFNNFLKLTKEHNLKANITADQWFDLVYKSPEFDKHIQVGTSKHSFFNENYYQEAVEVESEYIEAENEIDTLSQTIKIENGQEQIYSKYYVPFDAIHNSYSAIVKAYENPNVNFEVLTFFFSFIIGLSIIVFSFKVTSGKNWLIALVSLGIIGIIAGIISVLIRYDTAFSILYLFVFGCLSIYFLIILSSKTKKGISGITLNQMLWMFPAFFPIIYFIVYEIIKEVSGYNAYRYEEPIKKQFPEVDFMENHTIEMFAINIIIIFIFMLVMSRQIKKWKGIAED